MIAPLTGVPSLIGGLLTYLLGIKVTTEGKIKVNLYFKFPSDFNFFRTPKCTFQNIAQYKRGRIRVDRINTKKPKNGEGSDEQPVLFERGRIK